MLWSENFSYCIGIIASDGNLSSDGRHISITSKDIEIIENCRLTLKPTAKIARKSRGKSTDKKYFLLQFSDVKLYRFLLTIGLTPCKSKTIKYVDVPDIYFRDFLRGLFDGDGSISIFKNKVSKQHQVKMRFASASIDFLNWLKWQIYRHLGIPSGFITKDGRCHTLSYGKSDSFKIINFVYYSKVEFYLKRKYLICGRVAKLVSAPVLGTGSRKGLEVQVLSRPQH